MTNFSGKKVVEDSSEGSLDNSRTDSLEGSKQKELTASKQEAIGTLLGNPINAEMVYKQLVDRARASRVAKCIRDGTGRIYFCKYCSAKLSAVSCVNRHFAFCKKLGALLESDPMQVSDKDKLIREKQRKNVEKFRETRKMRKIFAFGVAYGCKCLICAETFLTNKDLYGHFSTAHNILL